MILVALGSNVPGPWGRPKQTVQRALQSLDEAPSALVRASKLLTTKPYGMTDQPDFINAVALITTELEPEALMAHLHKIELSADRRRTVRWGPRTLDLDLLDYNGIVKNGNGKGAGHQLPLILPHPGIAERKFVLEPLAEIAPDWQHPVSGQSVAELLQKVE